MRRVRADARSLSQSDQVQIQQLQDRLKVTMVDEILFAEGGWQLSRKGEETLAKIIPTLSGLKNQRIVVEGRAASG